MKNVSHPKEKKCEMIPMKIKTNQKINYTNYEELEALLKDQGYDLMVIPENCFDGDKIKAIQDENNILIEAAEENILCINKGSYCNAVYCSNQTIAIATGKNITISDEVVISNITSFAKDEGAGLFGGIKQLVSFEILINGNPFKKMEIPWNADIEKNAVSAIIKEIMRVKYSQININDAVEVFETKQHIKENFSEEIKEVFKIESEEVSSNSSFEEFDISFKVVSNRNPDVHIEGYVTINDEKAEDVDWYFWNGTGYQSMRFIFHDGISIKGSTIEQENELAQFESDLSDEGIWIDDVILQSDDTENRTYVRENLTLIINEGAKFEIEYEDYNSKEWDSQYYMKFIPKFNGKKITLHEDVYYEEPYTYEETKVSDLVYDNGYVIEIPKSFWEDDCDYKDEIISYYTESFKKAYAQSISRELLIYAKYGENAEQLFEECDISDIALVTDGNLHQFLIDEGIIDE